MPQAEQDLTAKRRVRLIGRLVVALSLALLASQAWNTATAGLDTADTLDWLLGVGLLAAGAGVLRRKKVARWFLIAVAWLVSLFAALVLTVTLGIDLTGPRLLLSPPEWAPLKWMWLNWLFMLFVDLLLLTASLGVWWLLTREAVRRLFCEASRSAA